MRRVSFIRGTTYVHILIGVNENVIRVTFGKEVCMEESYLWKRFEGSGDIMDYLNYTACTSEESLTSNTKEGERGGNTDYDYWNGVGCHAGW